MRETLFSLIFFLMAISAFARLGALEAVIVVLIGVYLQTYKDYYV